MRHDRARAKAWRLVAELVAWLPANRLRVMAWRLLGHRIAPGARIGLGTVIACARFECAAGVVIGRGNRFSGPFAIAIAANVFIGKDNRFDCGAAAALPAKAHMGYARTMTIGADALIHERHFFDIYGAIAIGARSWIAGCDSQFWTHGASASDRDITIGDDCYLGSAVRMAPGSALADRCVLGLGSVVTGKLDQPDSVCGGFPARVLRARDDGPRAFVFVKDGWATAA